MEWPSEVAPDEPISQLVLAWAKKHKVPVDAVGIEVVGSENLIDQARTPAELGWESKVGEPIKLLAFPTERKHMEEVFSLVGV